MNRISRRAAAVVSAVAAVPLLAGCYNGFDAQTNIQGPSGDGASAQIGDIMIRSATWVRSAADPRTLTLSTNLINAGVEPDQLVSVTTEPIGKVGINGSLEMMPLSEIRTGYNSDKFVNAYDTLVPPSGYVMTTFNFKRAGTISLSLLTVPPTGYYAGITPNPEGTGAQASPSGSTSASPSASGSASESASPSNVQ